MKIIRQGTSDEKAYNEVITKKGYERKNFKPELGEKWLDIGAHIGSFAFMYRNIGVHVKAFEPTGETFGILQENTPGENYNFALSNFDGESMLYRNTNHKNEWRNSLKKEWRKGEKEMVQIKLVDGFIEDNINIKLDAEGSEKEILNHLVDTNLINKVNKLVFEWSFDINKYVPDYISVLKKLQQTHILLNVTENHLNKYSILEEYPPSWFPAAFKVFCIKK